MDNLYSSPPYAYLPQQNTTVDNYHPSTGNLYRTTTNNTFDRPFHMEDHHHHPHHHHGHDLEPYHYHGWSSSSNHQSYGNYYGSNVTNNSNMTNATITSPRPKITTNLWEDEGTLCYQVDAKGICVARRQDNDMVNGTKLLNVVGMSRGKRDGILKNEKGRVVVKVGAMHLKGVWIPFTRATELAEKFKILDLLYPLFVDEPSIYLCNSSIGAAHNHNEVIPSPPVTNTATNNKCNMIPSPLPFTHRSSITTDDYSPSTTTLPSWDSNRPYSLFNSSSGNQYDPPQQVLHRNNSNPDLSTGGSPIPRSVSYNHHQHSDENDLYILNNHHSGSSNATSLDYYNNRPFNHHHHNNRGSFSSVSSHQSYLYSSLQHQHHHHEDEASKASSVTTPNSYMDNNSNSIYTHPYGGGRSLSQDNSNKSLYNSTSLPYIKSSPYTTATTITSLIDTNSANNNDTTTTTNRSSAGSTTPSSWFSPETPTAVLFQQVKDDTEVVNTKKRKASSASIEIGLKTLKKQQTAVTSPAIRATKKLSITEEGHNNDD